MDMENQERLARLETQMENMLTGLARIDDKLDMWNQNYVPRNEINEMFRARDDDIKELRENQQQERLDRRSFKTTWPSWVSAGCAFIMLLITIYVTSR
jgi:hypothetical protein